MTGGQEGRRTRTRRTGRTRRRRTGRTRRGGGEEEIGEASSNQEQTNKRGKKKIPKVEPRATWLREVEGGGLTYETPEA